MFLISLFSSLVLLALATSMVDITAGMIIQGFRQVLIHIAKMVL
jgi:hypothetical protein